MPAEAATLHVLRVFVNDEGEWGNPLGVFLEGGEVPPVRRQDVAAELGFSETVFVEDATTGELRIHTPAIELGFAGHPTVGAAWLLAEEGHRPVTLRPPAGEVGVRFGDGCTFVSARPEWCPPFEYRRLGSPADVRGLDPAAAGGLVYAWAWIDEDAGTVRARSFADGAGIAEDEATGSAALALCAALGRPITVHQGHGSVLSARPLGDGRAEVGGAAVLDEIRDYALPARR
jgi:predicted PhzF superfamily epimerase YddE/YHI9